MSDNLLTETNDLYWKVNTPGLLKEILSNSQAAILAKPLQIFGSILYEVGERAIELNDPKLNALMCRLSIYSQSDPYNPDYNEELSNKIISSFY